MNAEFKAPRLPRKMNSLAETVNTTRLHDNGAMLGFEKDFEPRVSSVMPRWQQRDKGHPDGQARTEVLQG